MLWVLSDLVSLGLFLGLCFLSITPINSPTYPLLVALFLFSVLLCVLFPPTGLDNLPLGFQLPWDSPDPVLSKGELSGHPSSGFGLWHNPLPISDPELAQPLCLCPPTILAHREPCDYRDCVSPLSGCLGSKQSPAMRRWSIKKIISLKLNWKTRESERFLPQCGISTGSA